MILSYHPCFVGDENRLCAGRQPDKSDQSIIARADAVILPQGVSRQFYEVARKNCPHVFPDYDARFNYPGKSGQIKLFRKTGAPHPDTRIFRSVSEYPDYGNGLRLPPGFSYPCIFKFHWGGESDNIVFLNTPADLAGALETAGDYEKTGQQGFLIQSFVPSGNRALRVVIIDRKMVSYWKIQEDPDSVCAGAAKGARIDPDSDPDLQQAGTEMVSEFCRQTGINLAGFDLLFPGEEFSRQALFLEINYFFGRKGLGGSERFYACLIHEIFNWLDRNGLPRPEMQENEQI